MRSVQKICQDLLLTTNVFDLMRNMNSTEECADQSKSKSGGENFPED